MRKNLFKGLREELRRNYGITKNSIDFMPFENWREKLKFYSRDFGVDYEENLEFLKQKLGLFRLSKVNNPDKKLILFLGIPGAGKTTLASAVNKFLPQTILLRGHDIVDLLSLYGSNLKIYRERLEERGFVNPDPWYLSYLYQEHLTRDILDLGYNVVFDDHIRTRINRKGYYNLAREHGAKIIFVQISAPFKIYMQREEEDPEKMNFLANMVFQSEDFSEEEMKKYGLIEVDGTSNLSEIKKRLVRELRNI